MRINGIFLDLKVSQLLVPLAMIAALLSPVIKLSNQMTSLTLLSYRLISST